MPSEPRRTPSRGPRGRSAARRASPRPAATAAASGVAAEAPRRSRLTGRAAILVLVVSVLAVSYASSMRAYLQQRDQIGDLKDQIALRQANISDLEREKRRWDDPAYVRQQARELNFVMPGETAYVVLDENGEPLERRDLADRPVDGRGQAADRVVGHRLGVGRAGRPPAEARAAAGDADRGPTDDA